MRSNKGITLALTGTAYMKLHDLSISISEELGWL